MKTSILFFFLFFCGFTFLNAQTSIDSNGNRVEPDTTVIYPKCKGDNEALKKCFTKSVHIHMARNMKTRVLSRKKVESTKRKMFFMFEVNNEGKVVNIKIKAPNSALEKEGLRILKLLPLMTPAKYKGNPLSTKFVLPFSLNIP